MSVRISEPHKLDVSMFARLAASWGISQEQIDATPEAEGEPMMLHADYDERQLLSPERRREASYQPVACTGTLRIQPHAPKAPVWEAKCDGCGFHFGFNAGTVDHADLRAARRERARIPQIFIAKPFAPDEGNAPARRLIRQWLGQRREDLLPAPALWGHTGVGKSHLLASAAEALIDRGHQVLFWVVEHLLDELQGDFESGSLWRELREIELLILDDLGAQRETDWRRDRVDALVDARYSTARPLLLSTNFPPKIWDELFGPRTASRLRGMTVSVEHRGPDRRQAKLGLPA